MPGEKGWLRTAIDDWLETNRGIKWWREYLERVDARYEELVEVFELWRTTNPLRLTLLFWIFGLYGIIYLLLGGKLFIDALRLQVTPIEQRDISKVVAGYLRDAFESPVVREITETLGAVVTEPVLTLFEQYAGNDELDPKEFARTFHGFMIGLTLAGSVADTTLEAVTAGQVEGVGRGLNAMYWTLGLGFLGWQTLAPLLSAGLQPSLERHYNDLYRPKRFSAGELRDLYALGRLDREQLRSEAKKLGWRDKDIEEWIELAFRNLSEGDVWALFHEGTIDQPEVIRRLRALGYDPSDIPKLFRINQKADVDEAKAVTLSTARQAFREGLIGESEFRELLAELERNPQEIDLLVQLELMKREQDVRSLTVSQIRAAWEDNVLSDAEVAHWLSQEGFGTDEVSILLRSWQAEVDPPFRRLNKGTITGAYVEGILTRTQAAAKLQEVGLTPEDARLELDLAEARNPESFGAPVPKPSRVLQLGQLGLLLETELITAAEMTRRLVEANYTQEDAELLTQAAVLRLQAEPRPLTQDVVLLGYLFSILTRQEAAGRLSGLGFTEGDAELLLLTFEQANPATFAPESLQSLRVPGIAALAEALRSGIVSEPEFLARMQELGFDNEGALLYLNLAVRQERRSAKTLTALQTVDAFEKKFIPYGEALARLMEQGYTNQDALLLLRLRSNIIQEQEPWKLMLAGVLQPDQAFEQLLGMGFTPEEIDAAIAELEQEGESA